jgi:hypothetical protein
MPRSTPIFQFACHKIGEADKKAEKRKYSKGAAKKVKRAMKKRKAGHAKE